MMAVAQRIEEQPSVVRLFDKAAFSAARYPRLQTVFERMLMANLDALREVFPTPPQYVFRDIQAEPLGEVPTRSARRALRRSSPCRNGSRGWSSPSIAPSLTR